MLFSKGYQPINTVSVFRKSVILYGASWLRTREVIAYHYWEVLRYKCP